VLVAAVDAVASGRRFLSDDVAHTLEAATEVAHGALTAREVEVLKLLVQGYAVADIARQLGLTQKTVANHQSTIKQKLGATTSAQLIHIATRLGLVPLTASPAVQAPPSPENGEEGRR